MSVLGCRLPGYAADDCLLEHPFYHEFPQDAWQLSFEASASLQGPSLQVQDNYVKKLFERKLVGRLLAKCTHHLHTMQLAVWHCTSSVLP